MDSEIIISNLGKRIRHLRKERRLTQAKLSEIMDVDESALRRLEIGNITNPKLSTLIKLCNAFEVSLDELVNINIISKK